jgi:hypothetical protein
LLTAGDRADAQRRCSAAAGVRLCAEGDGVGV